MGAIIGVLFAGIVGLMSIPTLTGFMNRNQENISAAAVAEHQTAFNAAVETYVKQNSVAIQAVADATNPATITVAMLQAPGVDLLPAGFNAINIYGQTWQAQVLEPTAGNLQVLSYSVGGEALSDAKASKIASLVKPSGGIIPRNDSGLYAGGSATAQGAYGKWTVSTANYGSISGGHLASLLTLNNGQLGSNYLYRNSVPGQPQLNQMNTPLIMAAVQTSGSACTTTGAIAQDGTGTLLSCQNGTWSQQGSAYWKDPVATFATLPTCNATTAWQTRIVRTPTVGTDPRAYTCTGAAWTALAVNDSGNLTVNGTATVGKVQINDVVVENTACSSNGLVARDSVGLILSCQSGIWKKSAGKASSIWSASNAQNMVADQTLSGIAPCRNSAGSSTGNTSINITVASNSQSINVSVGGNITSCYNMYACNGYGCSNPNGTYTFVGYSASGLQYQKYMGLGVNAVSNIYLTNSGFSGVIGWQSGSNVSGVYN